MAISNIYQNITSAGLSFRKTNFYHELGCSLCKIINENLKFHI